uniref:Innexin n=1 Tax=Trichobilharzia regenti TaxID=157069 RepID=A0AA85J6C4_TRIRE|nr:unnamed protein product [Trichobilharzia regenti]
MARGAGGLLDGGFVFKLGRLFKTPYGGEGVDFIDQLNYQFTGGLMVIFIAIISLRQYVGKPIQCWVPQEFTKSWRNMLKIYAGYQIHTSCYLMKRYQQIKWIMKKLNLLAIINGLL